MITEPTHVLDFPGRDRREAEAQRHIAGAIWLTVVWMAVAFTPPFRLPNGIPIRLDDLLVFGAGVVLLLSATYRGRVYRLRGPGWVLVAMSLYILCVTALGPPVAGLSVTLKEFADAVRPLKFLIILLAVSRLPYPLCRRTLMRVLPLVTYTLLTFSALQFALLTPESENAIAGFFLKFSELQEWHTRSFFGGRPFATFGTPTDLGYHASLVFAVALTLKDMPHRGSVMLACITTLVLSQTRTFVFVLPLLLPVYIWISSGRLRRKLRAIFGSALWIAAGAVIMIVVLPHFSDEYKSLSVQTLSAIATGDFEADQSIAQRLATRYLVEIALEHAPLTGMVSRDLSPETAFDSEYVMVMHRYGLIGLGLTAVFYGVVVRSAWRNRRRLPDVAWLVLWASSLTFLYGITQGVLVNTRTGSFLFIILGVFSAGVREVCRHRVPGQPGSSGQSGDRLNSACGPERVRKERSGRLRQLLSSDRSGWTAAVASAAVRFGVGA